MSYTSKELCDKAGITGRQLTHWQVRKWLVPIDRREGEGSGVPLEWSKDAVRKATLMIQMVNAGFEPWLADHIGQKIIDSGFTTYPRTVKVSKFVSVTLHGEGIVDLPGL